MRWRRPSASERPDPRLFWGGYRLEQFDARRRVGLDRAARNGGTLVAANIPAAREARLNTEMLWSGTEGFVIGLARMVPNWPLLCC